MNDTREQLLHLLNRAIDGVALHGEGDHLRRLVNDLEQRAKKAEADHDRVQHAACRTAETLRHAEDRIEKADAALMQVEAIATRWEKYGSTDLRTAARILRAEVLDQARQSATVEADEAPGYNRAAWETYRRDAKCACTSPDPSTCAVNHRPGPWLCVCHRLSAELTDAEREALSADCNCDPAPYSHGDGTYSHYAGCPIADAEMAADTAQRQPTDHTA